MNKNKYKEIPDVFKWSIDYHKIPRRLKKQLKSEMLKMIDSGWKTRELKIKTYTKNIRNEKGINKITSWSLG